ncbi:dihydrofolate reductase family protein [Dyadobacter crusticola]|uniref:dihydrofolate reductase family protein n=1 Tax=Dyadobacter crusticola TaxID=292407 RepID=UPI00068DD706|nr:dihydrofolate reductase family protein [Dyadobacter crusticola]
MGKLVVIEWLSLDGIFDTNLFDKWFFPFDSVERQQCIKQTTLANTAILYGRKTYDELSAYWPHNTDPELFEITKKLNETPKYVVTDNLQDAGWNKTTIISGDVFNQISELKRQPDQIIHVNGSAKLVQFLAEKGLIDEIQLLIHPVVLGTGQRFFIEGMNIPALAPTNIRQMDKGVLLVSYQVHL